MSAADDLEGKGSFKGKSRIGGESLEGIEFQVDKATGRLQRTDLGEIRQPYKWAVLNERFASDVVRQSDQGSCVAAVGQMLSKGELSEAELIKTIGIPGNPKQLAKQLEEKIGGGWSSKARGKIGIEEMCKNGPWAAMLDEYTWFPIRGNQPQLVMVEGLDDLGRLKISDPLEGTRYEMTIQDFNDAFSGSTVYRTIPPRKN